MTGAAKLAALEQQLETLMSARRGVADSHRQAVEDFLRLRSALERNCPAVSAIWRCGQPLDALEQLSPEDAAQLHIDLAAVRHVLAARDHMGHRLAAVGRLTSQISSLQPLLATCRAYLENSHV